jgi:2-polyprenyl-3-methyl-5-hydroxy-6-metoxy-1,4-benzoquinol methylase
MTGLLTPARRRGIELLDDPGVDPEVMQRSMLDVERANVLLGGRRAALAELLPIFKSLEGRVTMLDVGTGRGDIPGAAKAAASRAGISLSTVGMDLSATMVAASLPVNDRSVRGDAVALPFRDESFDIALASQVLHHFPIPAAAAVVREMNRVARVAVVLCDLRRSLLAAAGIWIGSFPLRFHPVSRHDGVVSVMRGFVASELADIVESATGQRPPVRRRLGFRLTTSFVPR